MASYVQTSFSGGMNMSVDDTRLTEDEYKFAHNVRNRFGVLEGVKQAVDISSDIGSFTSNPPTQAIYTLGEFVFLFFQHSMIALLLSLFMLPFHIHILCSLMTHFEHYNLDCS